MRARSVWYGLLFGGVVGAGLMACAGTEAVAPVSRIAPVPATRDEEGIDPAGALPCLPTHRYCVEDFYYPPTWGDSWWTFNAKTFWNKGGPGPIWLDGYSRIAYNGAILGDGEIVHCNKLNAMECTDYAEHPMSCWTESNDLHAVLTQGVGGSGLITEWVFDKSAHCDPSNAPKMPPRVTGTDDTPMPDIVWTFTETAATSQDVIVVTCVEHEAHYRYSDGSVSPSWYYWMCDDGSER